MKYKCHIWTTLIQSPSNIATKCFQTSLKIWRCIYTLIVLADFWSLTWFHMKHKNSIFTAVSLRLVKIDIISVTKAIWSWIRLSFLSLFYSFTFIGRNHWKRHSPPCSFLHNTVQNKHKTQSGCSKTTNLKYLLTQHEWKGRLGIQSKQWQQ